MPPPPIDDVKNWMNMFRWIVKLIRDEYGIEESRLTRTASVFLPTRRFKPGMPVDNFVLKYQKPL